MRKLILLLSFILVTLGALGASNLSNIETFSFNAREIKVVNNKNRVIEYSIIAQLPDNIRKEISYPTINEGEIHIYSKDTKKVYIPLLEIVDSKTLTNEENYIIKVVKDLKKKELEDPKFKEEFYKGQVTELRYDNGIRIVFDKLEKVDGYYFPVKISVYDGDTLQGEVVLKDIKINVKVGKEAFEI